MNHWTWVNHKHKESYDAKVEFEITKELISIRKSKKDRQHNDKKKDKERSTKRYTEN